MIRMTIRTSAATALCTFAGFAMALGGCASMRRKMNDTYATNVYRDRVLVDSSATESTITIRGLEEGFNDSPGNRTFLETVIDKRTGNVSQQLVVADHYEDHAQGVTRGWQSAAGEAGETLTVAPDRHPATTCPVAAIGDCEHTERFDVAIPEATLRAHPTGYRVVVTGLQGETLHLQVTEKQIRAQRATIDAIRTQRATK